jgi:YfiH family protein
MLTVQGWQAVSGLTHGFLPRTTKGAPGTSHDWTADVAARGVPGVSVVVARQVHGAHIETIAGPPVHPPEADALLTMTAGTGVGVVTADCVPLLLVAPEQRVAAAVHAGWRGTLAGIVPSAVTAVAAAAEIAAVDVHAALGPAIGGCCYEVGPDLRTAFEERYGQALGAPAFTVPGKRPHLDLRVFVRRQLEAAGLRRAAVQVLGPCTACDPVYASYRAEGPGAGRQLSFIGWL